MIWEEVFVWCTTLPSYFFNYLHCVKTRKGETINLRFGGKLTTFCNSAFTLSLRIFCYRMLATLGPEMHAKIQKLIAAGVLGVARRWWVMRLREETAIPQVRTVSTKYCLEFLSYSIYHAKEVTPVGIMVYLCLLRIQRKNRQGVLLGT